MDLESYIADNARVAWVRDGEAIVCRDGRDEIGRVTAGGAVSGLEQYVIERRREYVAIEDAGTGGRVATYRDRAHGPVAVEVGTGRYRVSREGLRFWSRLVTAGIGGDVVLRAHRIGPRVGFTTPDDSPLTVRDQMLLQFVVLHTWMFAGTDAGLRDGVAA